MHFDYLVDGFFSFSLSINRSKYKKKINVIYKQNQYTIIIT